MAGTPAIATNGIIGYGKGVINPYVFNTSATITAVMNEFYTTSWQTLLNGSQIDNILSAFILPITIPLDNSNIIEFHCGSNDFTARGFKPPHQFIKFVYGAITKAPIYNNYLDYAPYTNARIFLPCIGMKSIDLGEWWGKGKTVIGIEYQICILSGDLTCWLVYYDTESTYSGSHILYSYTGNCAFHLPMSGADYSRQVSSAFSLLGSATATIAGIASENPAVAIGGAIGMGQSAMGLLSKPQIDVCGSIAGSAIYTEIFDAYLLIDYPDFHESSYSPTLVGKPCCKYVSLGTLTGYTQVSEVHLEDIPCQDNELEELEMLLKEGVIL